MEGWVLGSLVLGTVIGAVFSWLVVSARHASRIAAAINEVKAPLAAEIATLTERTSRIHALESEAQALEQERDVARSANTELAEQRAIARASADRLPGLESKLQDAEVRLRSTNQDLADLRASLGGHISQLAATLTATQENLRVSEDALAIERIAREAAGKSISAQSDELSALKERFDGEKKNAAEKLALLDEAKEVLSNQFKTLANDILQENSKRFTDQNQANIVGILEPLRTKLKEFQDKVELVHSEGGKERFALTEQVKQLVALNHTLSEDAKNLTSALKGSSKSQGSWGELILERVLESSGLRKGHEYVVQERQVTEDGRRQQPDVVISLPEERYLVVDSKVSLLAYERYASAEADDVRASALKQHLESIRGHVKGLADKNYQNLYALRSLDFVLMFVPIEPAFILAVTHERELFMDAWQRNVLLVSPSTLLFVVRTVAHLWRQEAQSRNAQEIANRGAELYDKLVGFVEELRRVGTQLRGAQSAYEEAEKKLCDGRGNAIRQAEMLRDLGVKPTKQMPAPLVERASLGEPLPLRQEGDAGVVTSEAAQLEVDLKRLADVPSISA